MLRATWIFLLAVAIAGCSSSSGNSVPPAVTGPTPTPTATPVPTATPHPTPTATPTGKPTPTPTPTAKPTASPTPTAAPTATPTPVLNNPPGSLTFSAGANFPYTFVVTYGPNNAPDNGGTLVQGCAVNSTTLIGTGTGKCDTGGAPNAAGAIVWIAVTFEPGVTGNVVFGSDPNLSTATGLQAGTYTYIAYRGALQVGSGDLNLVGGQYTYASPFSITSVPDNVPTTIEIIKH